MLELEVNIIEDFNAFLNRKEYISYKEYNLFLEKYAKTFENSQKEEIKEIASNGYMKIEKHNEKITENKLIEFEEYFNQMFKDIDPNIVLDIEQRKAILNEEDYSLIIAGAGAGKTTTMAAKVKYLIEKKKINPKNIAVISYTNKATEELEDRIKYEFNLPVDIMTFHSLGIKMIRKVFEKPLKPITEKDQKEIIGSYVSEILFANKNLLTEYINVFNKYEINGSKMFAKGFVENYHKFPDFESYFNDYKRRKQEQNKDNLEKIITYRMENYLNSAVPKTIKNENMRSIAEAKIANFLYLNGIDYKYEEPYPEKVDEEQAYLPDFTVEVDGIPLYIEYFGLSTFYENGTLSEKALRKYNDIRAKKRAFHNLNHNNYIELDYKREKNGETIDYLEDLEQKLKEHHVPFKKRTKEEIYDQILNNNLCAEFFHFIDFNIDIINSIKTSLNRNNFSEIIKKYIAKEQINLEMKQ